MHFSYLKVVTMGKRKPKKTLTTIEKYGMLEGFVDYLRANTMDFNDVDVESYFGLDFEDNILVFRNSEKIPKQPLPHEPEELMEGRIKSIFLTENHSLIAEYVLHSGEPNERIVQVKFY